MCVHVLCTLVVSVYVCALCVYTCGGAVRKCVSRWSIMHETGMYSVCAYVCVCVWMPNGAQSLGLTLYIVKLHTHMLPKVEPIGLNSANDCG